MRKFNLIKIENKKITLIKMLLVAIPSYIVAFTTEKVAYVVPTIAMMIMIANSVEVGNTTNRNRLEDEASIDGESSDFDEGDGGV